MSAAILSMFANGHSVAAIACRLDKSEQTVKLAIRKAGISTVVVPPGYVSIAEAAAVIGVQRSFLEGAVTRRELHVVRCHGRWYTSMEAVSHWLDSDRHRQAGRELAKRVLRAN